MLLVVDHVVNGTCTGKEPPKHKMPGHWLLAKMGKRVLRPGGLQLTHQLLKDLDIQPADHVVEFAPGLGVTAKLALVRKPASYVGVERDSAAAETVRQYLSATEHRCVTGSAEETSLPTACATVVYGEAMLTMQPATTKERIIGEAARLLCHDGRYGIHELCLVPDDVGEELRHSIQQDLSDEIHVGVRPLRCLEWRDLLQAAGFEIVSQRAAPMHLLEPRRLVQDEGLAGALQFAWNVATHAAARQRVLRMRSIFRKYRDHLAAIAIVSRKVACYLFESITMANTYTYFGDLAAEVEPPADGTLSRTLYQDDHLKVVLFGFAAGQELSEHTASTPAVMHYLRGEAKVTLGADDVSAKAGTWIHMRPHLPHSIRAKTPCVMLLLLLKGSSAK